MIRRDLLGIILRLAAGFIILFAISFFLWRGLRRSPNQPEPSPTTVTVVTPTPTPTPSTLPTIGPGTDEGKGKATPTPEAQKDRDSSEKKGTSTSRVTKKIIITTKTYTTETVVKEDHYTRAGTSSSSAWAEARAGDAWARAEAGN